MSSQLLWKHHACLSAVPLHIHDGHELSPTETVSNLPIKYFFLKWQFYTYSQGCANIIALKFQHITAMWSKIIYHILWHPILPFFQVLLATKHCSFLDTQWKWVYLVCVIFMNSLFILVYFCISIMLFTLYIFTLSYTLLFIAV